MYLVAKKFCQDLPRADTCKKMINIADVRKI